MEQDKGIRSASWKVGGWHAAAMVNSHGRPLRNVTCRRVAIVRPEERPFQVKEIAKAKAMRQEHIWPVQVTARRQWVWRRKHKSDSRWGQRGRRRKGSERTTQNSQAIRRTLASTPSETGGYHSVFSRGVTRSDLCFTRIMLRHWSLRKRKSKPWWATISQPLGRL